MVIMRGMRRMRMPGALQGWCSLAHSYCAAESPQLLLKTNLQHENHDHDHHHHDHEHHCHDQHDKKMIPVAGAPPTRFKFITGTPCTKIGDNHQIHCVHQIYYRRRTSRLFHVWGSGGLLGGSWAEMEEMSRPSHSLKKSLSLSLSLK